MAGGGKVGSSNLSSRRELRLLLDFGRRGLEEKPSTGCPRKERQAKGLSKERRPFSHLRSPSVTSWSRSAWKQGVTSSHTSPRCFMRKQNRQIRRAHTARCGDYCSPNQMMFFPKSSSLVMFGRKLKLGGWLNAALCFSSAGFPDCDRLSDGGLM